MMSPISNKTGPDNPLTAAGAARLFVIGGMILIISGLIFGDLYAVFIMHPNVGHIGEELAAAVSAAASGDADGVMGHFGMIGGFLENAGTKKDTHVHIIQVGYLAFILAFLQPMVALEPGRKLRLAKTFLWAAAALPVSIFLIHYVGLVYSPLNTIGWASIFADLAGLVLTLVLAAELFGMWLHARGRGEKAHGVCRLDDRNSRTLLIWGVVLILAGFIFGAYYAGALLREHEQRELAILGELMARASAGDFAGIDQSLGAYGGLQVAKAVMIAAHAHVIEFGLLALMMAIAQPYVFLNAAWRRRLVLMLLGGSVVLPVAVYSEIWFGLLTGAVADFAGLMIIFSLLGMLFGVLRQTGKLDAAAGESV